MLISSEPERAIELLSILLPSRIDFHRKPIETEATSLPEQAKEGAASSAAADLVAASRAPAMPEPVSIYGSVSTADVAATVRAVLARNDEAARVALAEEDITFVGQTLGDDETRLKHLGDFEVEMRIRGADEAVKRIVRVLPQDA